MIPVFKKLLKADIHFQLLLIRVLVLLGIGRLAVLCLPFKKIAKWMGEAQQETIRHELPEHREFIHRVYWAIRGVQKYTFWESNCFAQALCAHWILKKRKLPHTIYFGVKKDQEEALKAHAWLRVGTDLLTGGNGHKHYTVVGTFAYQHNQNVSF